jgi:hypothetical protein
MFKIYHGLSHASKGEMLSQIKDISFYFQPFFHSTPIAQLILNLG